mmetsp:Transcript_5959/g.16844  ORF Transcript_5959/g.16844 Transcript_5959/m.16844 type:complete len:226 (+) Transcript_5959:579-1256(+)
MLEISKTLSFDLIGNPNPPGTPFNAGNFILRPSLGNLRNLIEIVERQDSQYEDFYDNVELKYNWCFYISNVIIDIYPGSELVGKCTSNTERNQLISEGQTRFASLFKEQGLMFYYFGVLKRSYAVMPFYCNTPGIKRETSHSHFSISPKPWVVSMTNDLPARVARIAGNFWSFYDRAIGCHAKNGMWNLTCQSDLLRRRASPKCATVESGHSESVQSEVCLIPKE